MSLMDLRRGIGDGARGLDPPPHSPAAIWEDLRWHARIYRMDALDRGTRLAFLALRVVQRLAYNLGWHEGRPR